MGIRFCFWMAKKLIWGNKERSIIPFLGIAVGVSLVFTILAVSDGGRRSVKADLYLLGENRVMIGPNNTSRAKAFNTIDVNSIERVPGVDYVHLVENRIRVTTSRANSMEMTGYSSKTISILEVDIVAGKGFPLRKNEIILEERAAKEEFGTTDVIGRKLEIQLGGRRIEYKIKGVYRDGIGSIRELGGAMVESYQLEEILGQIRSREMIVALDSEAREEELYPMILSILDRNHGGRNLYRVFETNERYRRIEKIMRIINLSLGAIGIVTLILGGAGVVNMMLLSIKERVPHIGILRATGTSKITIGRIFLFECLIFTLLGGLLGVPGGLLTAQIVGRIIEIAPKYSVWQVVVTIFISIFMGVVAGYYPAKKASDMEPMEAIRKSF